MSEEKPARSELACLAAPCVERQSFACLPILPRRELNVEAALASAFCIQPGWASCYLRLPPLPGQSNKRNAEGTSLNIFPAAYLS
jgi:hypothetical protein